MGDLGKRPQFLGIQFAEQRYALKKPLAFRRNHGSFKGSISSAAAAKALPRSNNSTRKGDLPPRKSGHGGSPCPLVKTVIPVAQIGQPHRLIRVWECHIVGVLGHPQSAEADHFS